MAKIDKTVKKETAIIAGGSAVCSVLMNLIFFLVARFTDICEYKYTVITGSVLGWAIAVLNFLLMGVTIQNAVALEDNGKEKNTAVIYAANGFARGCNGCRRITSVVSLAAGARVGHIPENSDFLQIHSSQKDRGQNSFC